MAKQRSEIPRSVAVRFQNVLHGRLGDGTAISALQRHAKGGSRFASGETVSFGYEPGALHVMKCAPA